MLAFSRSVVEGTLKSLLELSLFELGCRHSVSSFPFSFFRRNWSFYIPSTVFAAAFAYSAGSNNSAKHNEKSAAIQDIRSLLHMDSRNRKFSGGSLQFLVSPS